MAAAVFLVQSYRVAKPRIKNWDEVTRHIAAMPLCDGKLEFELSIAAEQLPEAFERCSNFAENYFPGK